VAASEPPAEILSAAKDLAWSNWQPDL